MSRSPTTSQHGVSLIEVLLALTILAVVLMALGGLMFQVGRHTRNSAAVTYRSAAAQMAAAWSQAVPWDSIPAGVGCSLDTTGQLSYNRCVSVSTPSANLRQITTVIGPVGSLTVAPDTVVVDRNRPRLISPLRRP